MKQKDYENMVDDLCGVEEGLTKWECNFVSDMKDWRFDYSKKQKEFIEKIWEKVFK